MSYLLAQILVCLLIAGLIGAVIGWLLRGGCKNRLRELNDKWSAKYDTQKAIWQGKIDSAEAHVQKSVQLNNDEWDTKLRDLESSWETKVKALVSNYDKEKKALEEELEATKLKLKESSSDDWASKAQGAVAGFAASQVTSKDDSKEIEALKEELEREREIAKEAKLKLAEVESEYQKKLDAANKEIEDAKDQLVKIEEVYNDSSFTQPLSKESEEEIAALKAELEATKAELEESDRKWSLKLEEAKSDWASKAQGAVAGFAASQVTSKDDSKEIEALKEELEREREIAKEAKLKLAEVESEYQERFEEIKKEVESTKSELSNSKDLEQKLEELQSELETQKNRADEAELKLTNLENEYQERLDEAKREAENAKEELEKTNSEWELKLKESESNWEGKLQTVIGEYDSKLSKIDEDRAKLEADLEATKAEVDEAKSKLIEEDAKLFAAVGHLDECYEVEAIEGIGAGFGKKFRAMGIETTCEFADRFLDNPKAIKEAAKETKIDADAIAAWASMADLMRLPGVDGQYAEIMQVVGVDSRDELSKTDPKTLHTKMKEYNAKNPIVPDVPGLGLVMKWTKTPDSTKIVKALESMPKSSTECYDVEEIEGVGPAYGRKLRALGMETTCDVANLLNDEDALTHAANQMGVDKEALKAWAKMADIMKLPDIDGQYAEILQVVGVSSKDDIKNFNPKSLHQKMVEYNTKSPIVPEVPSLELLSKLTGKEIDLNSDDDLDNSKAKDLNECYDIEEIEGIGPGYGKRLRNMGINTTCELADKCLIDNNATKKVSKKMKVDFDAVRAWASMADLMRLPGVGGQYAEIMQTVGVSSRKELTKLSINSLHRDMVEFNTKNPIVPEVPTLDMLKEWVVAAKKQH